MLITIPIVRKDQLKRRVYKYLINSLSSRGPANAEGSV